MASENTREAIRQELEMSSAAGAGLAALLDQLQQSNRRLRWHRRLSHEELEELKLFCWALERDKPTGQLWGQARALWGGAKLTRPRPKRRARPAA